MATTFTIVNSWTEGSVTGKRRVVLQGTLTTDGSDGATAGDIPASTFGLALVEEITGGTKSDNTTTMWAQPSYDQTSIIGLALTNGVAGDIASGTYALTVKGQR